MRGGHRLFVGARPGEVLNLRRGCIEHDIDTDMWLMSGVYFKNAVDGNGNKIPAGARRRDPWIVVKPVADAVTVLERLHAQELLFPAKIEPYRHRPDVSHGVGRPEPTPVMIWACSSAGSTTTAHGVDCLRSHQILVAG